MPDGDPLRVRLADLERAVGELRGRAGRGERAVPVTDWGGQVGAGQRWFWFFAVQAWEDNDGDPRVHACRCADRHGTDPDEANLVWVYLPHRRGEDPNVQVEEVIPARMVQGEWVCGLDTSDGKVGASVRIWIEHNEAGEPINVPDGWEPWPAGSQMFLKGVRLVGPPEEGIGDTAGSLTHAHDAHPEHSHGFTVNGEDAEAGTSRTVGKDETHDTGPGGGPWTHISVDHQPPYIVVSWIWRAW